MPGADATVGSYSRAAARDPTSITDYALFAYEAGVSEFGGQRRSLLPFLVRADATGARRVRWELLANLETASHQPVLLIRADRMTPHWLLWDLPRTTGATSQAPGRLGCACSSRA